MPKIVKKKKRAKIYLGIDPGKSGGLASIYGEEVVCKMMPESNFDVFYWLNGDPHRTTLAMVEWIHPAIQGIGKSAMSKLYGNFTALQMALTALNIPQEVIKPVDWQRGLKIPKRKRSETTSQWKNRLRARAQELYPKLPLWSKPKTKGIQLAIADALLIATYCKRREEGTL